MKFISKFIDLSGKTFNGLKVIKRTKNNKYGTSQWECVCQYCGNTCIKRSSQLRANQVYSCGCMKKELHTNKIRKYNDYKINEDETVEIKFSNSDKIFICDLNDWKFAKKYNWTLHHTGYAYTTINSNYISFHNFIINNKDNNLQIDHIDINPLNNKRKNLRIVTISQNMMNKHKYKNNTSGYRGINYNKKTNKWIVRIGFKNNRISLGQYDILEDAIKARKEAENKYFGEYKPNN